MKSRFLMTMIAAAVLGHSAAASAEIVTAVYSGTVSFVFDEHGEAPSASVGDSLVATYVFDLQNASSTSITPTGGIFAGPYGSFVTASLSVNGVTATLPGYTTGQINGESHVFGTGTVVSAQVTAGSEHLSSYLDSENFTWQLTPPYGGFSYNTSAGTAGDDSLIQLATASGDLLEGQLGNLTVTVTSVPELSTWAMLGLGFAGCGLLSYRRGRVAATPAV